MTRILAAVLVAVAVAALSAQRDRFSQSEQAEMRALVAAVDRVMKGEPAAAAAHMRWQPHFLRSPDGRTYVPYTITIEDIPENTFSAVALYVRVAVRGDRTISTERDKRIGPTGADVPLFAYDAAAAASNRLRLLDRPDQKQAGQYPFEAAHFGTVWWSGRRGVLRRALMVPPGTYDLYVAVRERADSVSRHETPQASVIKREIEVPDFSTKALAMSSPILAASAEPVRKALEPREQVARPYAFGSTEILPVLTPSFSPSDALTVVFFVYNAGMDGKGKPDVAAEFSFFRLDPGGASEPFGRPLEQRFDQSALPPEFDMRQGHPLVPVQSLPLTAFPPGQYRLEIKITDRIASANASRDLQFAVR